jgi:hypothetical protein
MTVAIVINKDATAPDNSLREHVLEFASRAPNIDTMMRFEKLGSSREATGSCSSPRLLRDEAFARLRTASIPASATWRASSSRATDGSRGAPFTPQRGLRGAPYASRMVLREIAFARLNRRECRVKNDATHRKKTKSDHSTRHSGNGLQESGGAVREPLNKLR